MDFLSSLSAASAGMGERRIVAPLAVRIAESPDKQKARRPGRAQVSGEAGTPKPNSMNGAYARNRPIAVTRKPHPPRKQPPVELRQHDLRNGQTVDLAFVSALSLRGPHHLTDARNGLVDDGPEQQYDGERGDRADLPVRPEHKHVAA